REFNSGQLLTPPTTLIDGIAAPSVSLPSFRTAARASKDGMQVAHLTPGGTRSGPFPWPGAICPYVWPAPLGDNAGHRWGHHPGYTLTMPDSKPPAARSTIDPRYLPTWEVVERPP